MRRMLTARLQNRSGVLNRFTGVLSRRQVNIESISVGATEDPNVSRITIIIDVASHFAIGATALWPQFYQFQKVLVHEYLYYSTFGIYQNAR